MFLAYLAEAYALAGRVTEGLNTLREAFDFMAESRECLGEAELHRLEGALLLMTGDGVGASVSFHKAIAVARRQRAKSWELRATLSLARLWHAQGKGAQAREMLARVYDWFTEGFDTADLQEARALLDEWGGE